MVDMTTVRNRLTHPDGAPQRGVRVDLIVRAVTDWRLDRTGRVVGSAQTWTNEDGCWRIGLLPYTEFEAQTNTIVEVREDQRTSGYIQVPPSADGREYWIRELLVEPPTSGQKWSPIARLDDLHDVTGHPAEGDVLVYEDGSWRPGSVATSLSALDDVDGTAIDDADDSSVLIKQGGVWTAVSLRLRSMTDVDEHSMRDPKHGDVLTYLTGQGWGINRQDRQPLTWTATPVDVGDGRTITLTINSRQPFDLYVYWGDEERWRRVAASRDLPVGTDTATHTYAADGRYTLEVGYIDDSVDEGATASNFVFIPLEEPVEGSNE